MATKFIYFDLGNVLLNFSRERMSQQIAELFAVDAKAVHDIVFQEDTLCRFERGEISSATGLARDPIFPTFE